LDLYPHGMTSLWHRLSQPGHPGSLLKRAGRVESRNHYMQLLRCSLRGGIRPWHLEEHGLAQASTAPLGVKRRIPMILAAGLVPGLPLATCQRRWRTAPP